MEDDDDYKVGPELACPNCGENESTELNLAPGAAHCHSCGTDYPIPE